MSFKKSLTTIFILSGLSMMSQTLCADNRAGAFVVSPGVGAYLFNTDRNVKNNAIYNLGIGYDFNRNWGIEALAGTVPTTLKSPVLGSQSVRADFYSFDGVYHINTNIPLVPYVLAGAGLLNFNSSQPQLDTQANLNAGAGLEYFLGNSFALRSDVRDIYSVANGHSDVLVNFGVSVLLGGRVPSTMQNIPVSPADNCSNNKIVVRFSAKSNELDPIYKAKLQNVISCLENNPNLRLNIDGYANSLNNPKLNLSLAQQRAGNIKNYLEQAGIEPSRMAAQGFGDVSSTRHPAPKDEIESVVISMFGKRGY